MKNFIVALVFACAAYFCVNLFIVYELGDGSKPPIWYSGNQIDWDRDHAVRPNGVDEISDRIIDELGIRVVPWDHTKILTYLWFSDVRVDWEGDKLLVRYLDGIEPFHNQLIHPRLVSDPFDYEEPVMRRLRFSLHSIDHGFLWRTDDPPKEQP